MSNEHKVDLDEYKDLEIYDLEAVKRLKEAKKKERETKKQSKKEPLLTRVKRQYSTKKFKQGAYSSLLIVGILIAVLLINFVTGKFNLSFDCSEQSMYTLTSQSQEVANQLKDNVTIYYISESGSEIAMMKNIIDNYEKLSNKIHVVYKDPLVYPSFTTKYVTSEETVESNSVIVVNETTGAYKYIPYEDMLEYDYTNYYYGYSDSPEVTAIDVEGQVTGAISYVASEEITKLYEVTGHGESSLSTYVKNEISKRSTEVNELAIRTAERIPEDCEILLINGPTTDFTEAEITMIKDYLQTGGKAIMTTNYTASTMSNYTSLLKDYGIQMTQGVVMEGSNNSPSNYPYYTFAEIVSHELTENISINSNPVILPFMQGMQEGETRSTVTITPFLTTSDDAFCKTKEDFTTLEKENGDVEGPFDSAVLVTETYNDVETTLIVVASNYLFDDAFTQYDSYGNTTLIHNMIAYLGGQETGLSIPTKSLAETYVVTTDAQVVIWTIVLVIALPLAFVIVGVTVWYRRRRV